MSLLWPPKDPAETLDYDIDWSLRLNGDSILTSEWSIPPGVSLTILSNLFNPTMTKVFLSGGVLGQVYTLSNTIITVNGDTMVESVQILMQSK